MTAPLDVNTRVRHTASGRTGVLVRLHRRFATDGAEVWFDGEAGTRWVPLALLKAEVTS